MRTVHCLEVVTKKHVGVAPADLWEKGEKKEKKEKRGKDKCTPCV